MGNLVLMAVRNEGLDKIEKLDFSHTIYNYMNRSDALPKLFDANEPWSSERRVDMAEKNIVFSQHYHTSGKTTLYVNNQMLMFFSPMFGKNPQQGRGFEGYISPMRKYFHDEGLSMAKSKHPASHEAQGGTSVYLFTIWTDALDILESNPYLMVDVVRCIRTNERTERTFGQSSTIEFLGSIEADQAVMVGLSSHAVMDTIPCQKMDMPAAALATLLENLGSQNRNFLTATRQYETAIYREWVAGFGYTVKEIVAKR
jgi:hypothetical protein